MSRISFDQEAISTTHPLPVTGSITATTSGSVAVDSIAAGDNNIGNVDIASALPTGTNSIGGTKDNGPYWTSVFGVSGASIVTTSASAAAVAVTDAPTTGQKIVLTDLLFSTSAAMTVTFLEETTSGSVGSYYMPANGTLQVTPRGKLKLSTANKKLMVSTSAAGSLMCLALYYSEA